MFRSTHYTLTLYAVLFPLISTADDFRDFRIPSHKVHHWLAAGEGRASQGSRSADNDYANTSEDFRLNISSRSRWLWENDWRKTWILGSVSLSGNKSNWGAEYGSIYAAQSLTESSRRKYAHESWLFAATQRWYPCARPVGVDVSLQGSGSYEQMFESYHRQSRAYYWRFENTSGSRENWNYEYNAHGDAQLGYGRVRNVSGVFSAMIVAGRLRETGALSGDLSHETLQKLAELFYRIEDYSLAHIRPDRYFWLDFWEILRADPAVRSGAENAYNAYRIAETPAWGATFRESGWFIGPVFRGSHLHEIRRGSSSSHETSGLVDSIEIDERYSSSDTDESWYDEASVGGKLEYHLPRGPRWQFDGEGAALFSLTDSVGGFIAESFVKATYIIADRWLAEGRVSQTRQIFQGHNSRGYDKPYDYWGFSTSANLSYFLEDRWRITGRLSNHQQKNNRSGNYGSEFARGYGFSIGFSYGPGQESYRGPFYDY